MSSIYPNGIDGFQQIPVVVDDITPVNAESVNRLRTAIINIETELGVEPSGSYSTVTDRLDALDTALGSGEFVKVSSNDTTAGYLIDKFSTSTTSVSITELNDGGNETVEINVTVMTGDSGAGGAAGLVPVPGAGDAAANRFLKADGTWTTPAGSGDFVGPAGAVLDNVITFGDGTGKLGKDSGVAISTITSHISSTANPHSTDVGNLGNGTLAELNTIITDATLDDSSATRTPSAHAASHENAGGDEISVADLSGELADAQKVAVSKNSGATVARSTLNFIEGTNITLTIADDGNEIDITIDAAGGGGGNVSNTGTPVNNQLAVWTDATTIEGDASLTFDTTTDTLAVAASGKFAFGAVTVLDDTAGTTTLSNIDALDATTEATIEAAIDTLANLTSASSLATVGTITTGTWEATDVGVAHGGTGLSTFGGVNTVLYTTAADTLASDTNFTWNGTALGVTGNITVSGTVDGVDIATRDHDSVTLNAAVTDVLSLSTQEITAVDAGAADALVGWDDGNAKITYLSSAAATATLDDMVGDSGAGGTAGLAPAPGAGDAAANKFLHADGTWTVPAGSGNVSNTGTPVNNQLAVWTDATTIEGDASLTFDTTSDTLAIGASGNLAFGAVTILSDAAGTTTLNNIDALDATTETTIEAAIDTLANLTSASSLATVGTITAGTWEGTDVAVAHGGTGLSTFGGVNTVLYTTAADALASDTNFTWNGTALGVTGNITVSGTVDGVDIAARDHDAVTLNAAVTDILSLSTQEITAVDAGAVDALVGWDDGNAKITYLSSAAATATLDDMVGDSGAGGTAGLAPAPGAGDAASNKFLHADGTWTVPGGGGNVSNTGTPVNNQLAVWTDATTIEGDASLTFDTTSDTLAVAASGKFAFGAVTILDDTAGTTTLSNIDALDATTESTIEAAIDTLANLTSASSLATVGTIGTGTWQADTVAVSYGGTGATSFTSNAILTGNSTSPIQAEGNLLFDGSDLTLYEAVNDGNPSVSVGSIATETLVVQSVYDGGAQTLDKVTFTTKAASVTADKGLMEFYVDEALIVTIDDDAVNLASGKEYEINGTSVLNATTLGSGVTGSSLTSVGTIGTGTWQGTAIAPTYGGTGQNTSASTGVAQVASGTWSVSTALADGTTATTQTPGDNSTKVATTAYVDATGGGNVSNTGTPVNNQLAVWTDATTIEGDASLTFDTTTDTLAVAASGKFAFGAVTILDDTAGTTTLSNIDALDATTEATIEAAIDTLANLTSASSLATVGTVTSGTWQADTVAVSYGGTGATSFTSNAILTGNSTSPIQAEGNLLFDGSDLTLYEAVNDGNPSLSVGSVATETLVIQSVYDGGAQTLDKVTFTTKAASVTADKGLMEFYVDEALIVTIDDDALNLASGKVYEINGTSVLSSTTLGSGVTGSSLTSVGTIGTGTWEGTDVGVAHGGTGLSTFGGVNTVLYTTAADVLASDTNFTWNGTALGVTGNITVSGTVDGVDIAARDHDAITLNAAVTDILSLSTQEITAVDAGAADALVGWDDGNVKITYLSSAAATATLDDLVGDSGAGGTAGLAPAPGAGDAAANKFLHADGTWTVPAGSGNVSNTGTPVNNQIAVWTDSTTIEGDASLTFDTTSDTLAVAASGKFAFGAVTILDDTAGTTTLSNIDALDATTEATIETAIDTLGNLTSASSLATVGTIGTGTWQADTIAVSYGGTGATSFTSNAILTGNSTSPIQAEGNLLFDGSDLTLYEAVNDGNPSVSIGSVATETLVVQSVYDGAAQTLDKVTFTTKAASVTADKGLMEFYVDEALIVTIDDDALNLASGKVYEINGTSVLSSTALGSGVTGSSLTSVGTIATGTWEGTDVGVAHGGTGLSTFGGVNTVLYTTAADTLASDTNFTWNGTALGITGNITVSGTVDGVDIAARDHDAITLNAAVTDILSLSTQEITAVDAGAADALIGWDDGSVKITYLSSAAATATLDDLVGDSGAGGTAGLAPAPAAGDAASNKFLHADGTWTVPAGSGNVSNTGTPVNNQIAVWTDATTIEGDASLTWDGTSFNIATAKNFQIAGITILADAAGTTTLSAIDAIDATTEATIEAAIDTLANLTSASSLATVGTITSGTWEGTDVGVAHGGTGLSTFGGVNTILYTTAADTLASITTGNDSLLITGATGIPSISTAIPDGVTATTQAPADNSTKLATTAYVDAAGGGNVSNTGTPVDNQIAVWTDATTIEGTTALTFDGSDFAIYETVNDGNPTVSIGSSTAEAIIIQSVYDSVAQTLDKVTFTTKAASVTADKGLMEFYVDEVLIMTLDDGAVNIATGKEYEINGTSVLNATTLGSGVTGSSLTSVGTIGTGTWQGTAIGATYGGTGINSSAATGVAQVAAGTWSVSTSLASGTDLNGNPIVTGEASGLDDEILTYNGASGDVIQGIGLKNFGPLATVSEPTGNASGDLYYNTDMDMWMVYDSTRSKWLSQEVMEVKFGRAGNTAANSYYQGIDGQAYSSTIGRDAEWNGTVVSIVYTRSDTDSATFEVTAGGSATGAELASTALKGTSLTLNSDFNQNDVLGVRNKTGGNTTSNVMGTVRIRWRAT